ncbi:uncharacterized protein LOC120625421 [Pararge aegeria]|uniref:uncharacterized protein LOC120625421 n=1 Tax=Pararge aegeria TaxID=116150 RepID=UPI0019D29732|nr:uncharacterized protein LOC120625421 [Pararge aegeria]
MGCRIIIFTFAAFFCQVQSQLCVNPGVVPQVIANPQLVTAPQVISSPLISTTIVDNSVSTALANALQLLIVSNIIESKLGASCLTNLLNVNPVIEPVAPCYPRVNIAEYITPITPCTSSVEIISPCRSFIEPIALNYGISDTFYSKPYGAIEPYPYLGCSEILPNLYDRFAPCGTEIVNPWLSNVYLRDVVTPSNYCGVDEIISPTFYPYNNCGVDIITSSPFTPICGNDVVAIPSYNPGCFGGFNEIIAPIPYTSCGDIITPFNPCGVTELISPCGPFYGGLPEVITPINPCNTGCFGNVAEFVTPYNYFGGISEIISPISPCNPGCGVPEICSPCSPYYGGIPEVISPVYKPGCAGIPELLPSNPFGPCRGPEIVTPCVTNSYPEVIIPTSYCAGCSGCEFCGPAAFPTNFGYLPSWPGALGNSFNYL